MVRGATRSPSPTGSRDAQRSRREDGRYARETRDDSRHYRRRSRSPIRDRRIRDRERSRDRERDYRRYDRRDRDRDRDRQRDQDLYRPDRRDKSREKPARQDANDSNSRTRNRRERRNDSRDRQRRSPDPVYRGSSNVSQSQPNPPPSPQQTEEEKKAERLARVDAWKKKMKTQKEQDSIGSTRELLAEMDKRAAAVTMQAEDSPTTPSTPQVPPSPTPYAGKFDPKAIKRKATASLAPSTKGILGEEVVIPKKAKTSASPSSPVSVGRGRGFTPNTPADAAPTGPPGTFTSFGLAKRTKESQPKVVKPGVDLGSDDESHVRKLKKLPTLEEISASASTEQTVAEDEDDDEDAELQNAWTEEEAAAAARAAMERREARLLAESQAEAERRREGINQDDVVMDGTGQTPKGELAEEEEQAAEEAEKAELVEEDEEEEEEAEDVDPLDAYMATLHEQKTPGGRSSEKVIGSAPNKRGTLLEQDEGLQGMDPTEIDDIAEVASKGRKKREIPTVDHSTIKYDDFRKKFYVEPSEVAEMSPEEVAITRMRLDDIKVRGLDPPKPVEKWSQFGLGLQQLEIIQQLGYEKPTPIQAQTVPAIMSGRDVIGIAKTGSGKTIAFLLPMFRHIKDQRDLESGEGPIGLVMAPTRELATQIHKECRPWIKKLGLRAVCAYGGAPIKDQIAQLKGGAEIVVCTPGRLIDLLAANSGRVTNLRRVTYMVLDEADRMFDMGFEPQIMKILASVRPDRQTVLFSATFPRTMEALARKTLTRPIEILVGGRSVVAPEIEQIVEVREEGSKFFRLLQLLGEVHEDEDARSLVFVEKQESAEELMNAVLRKGYPCFTIHGGKDQYDRDNVISDYKAGIFPVLIATSVAARGLDVKQLKMVVNFDCPNHLEDYVHRAGRTGRAGNKGLAVTFITPEQGKFSVDIVKALTESKQAIPEDLLKLRDGFMEKVKHGKERAAGSGFGGKGLERLEKQRDLEKARERKAFRTGDEPEEEEPEDKKEEAEDIVVKPAGSSTTPAAGSATNTGIPEGIDLDAPIKVHKTEQAEPADTADRMKGVSEAVAAINARLRKQGDIRGNAPIDNKGPDAGAFHSTLEINDFPQKARWAVTNRTNVAKILEATGTSITTKGNFYKAGDIPGANDPPKLYILVEGDTEVVVTSAMRELMRLLKEGTAAAADTEARAPVSGRYKVV